MNEEALHAALQPVKQYFKAHEVNRGTVMAAYLRRDGLTPVGESWYIAMSALNAGLSFEEAAEETKSLTTTSAGGFNASKPVSLRESSLRRNFTTVLNQRPTERPVEQNRASRRADAVSPQAGRLLHWYPKPTRAGDMDGEGLQKLLGTPTHDNLSILIRETAQNSWDARRADGLPELTYGLREVDDSERQILKLNFEEGRGVEGLQISSSLDRDDLRVLEISDRGTSGLGGPTRNDLLIEDDHRRDFVNLVLNVGVPRDVDKGGGTYGFGKIATYRSSRCRTIIIWTRTQTDDGPEHRLIAVSLGSSFRRGNRMHTGHHWWGRVISDDGPEERVEPLVGDEAERLGQALFSTPFGDEFGTSILVIDPDVEDDHDEPRIDDFVREIRTQLWPKFVDRHDGQPPMRIRLQVDGEEIPTDLPAEGLAWRHYGRLLEAVRAVQDGQENPNELHGVQVHPVESGRPKVLIGHLALGAFPKDETRADSAFDPPANAICLMRNVAELVVKYEEFPMLPTPDLSWCGVFKPVPETDDAFAQAEPPAHDDWLPESITNKSFKSLVRVAQRRRREKISEFLKPYLAAKPDKFTSTSAGVLADALGWMVPSVNGEDEPKNRRGSSRRRVPKRAVGTVCVIEQNDVSEPNSGLAARLIKVKLEGASDVERRVTVGAAAVTEVGQEQASEIKALWASAPQQASGGIMSGGETAEVYLEFPRHLVASVDFKVDRIGEDA